VIGLTTALTLEEHGHDVRVVAAGTDDATTSAVAGACWFPYRAGPPDRVAAWAGRHPALVRRADRRSGCRGRAADRLRDHRGLPTPPDR
jgi:glycine/D-amino acid oxidase-like deaminating enzyme